MFGKGFPFLNSAGGFYPRGNLSFPLQVTGGVVSDYCPGSEMNRINFKEEGGPCLWFAIFIHPVGFIERRLDPLICLRYSFPCNARCETPDFRAHADQLPCLYRDYRIPQARGVYK